MMTSRVFEELTVDQCQSLLTQNRMGRVAVSIRALPVVLPVTYGLVDGAIVFCTFRGPRLPDALAGTVVAFEIDDYDADTREGWSVLVQGRAEVIADPAVLGAALALGLEPWSPDGEPNRYVQLPPTVISGRQVRRIPQEAGPKVPWDPAAMP
jgi:nitroimidazol reductase NimA-like FMN-containing flavoprotein (pyridoxamine 5'-phosphate oxidase superfamily)